MEALFAAITVFERPSRSLSKQIIHPPIPFPVGSELKSV